MNAPTHVPITVLIAMGFELPLTSVGEGEVEVVEGAASGSVFVGDGDGSEAEVMRRGGADTAPVLAEESTTRLVGTAPSTVLTVTAEFEIPAAEGAATGSCLAM